MYMIPAPHNQLTVPSHSIVSIVMDAFATPTRSHASAGNCNALHTR